MLLVIGLVAVLILAGAGALAVRARQARPADTPAPSVPGARRTPHIVPRAGAVQPATEERLPAAAPSVPRPLVKAAPAPRAARVAASQAGGTAPGAPSPRHATVGRPALPVAQIRQRPALPAPRRDRRQTILIVDDSLVMQRSLANLFGGAGYSTAVAEHGEAALDWVAANGMPALITLDMEMPGRNGVETLRDLYAMGGAQPVPAIFITTRQPAGLRESTSPMGVLGYFSKPFIPEDLLVVARQTVPQVAQAAL